MKVYVSRYISMYPCVLIHLHEHMNRCMYMYIHIHMYVYVCRKCTHLYVHAQTSRSLTQMSVYNKDMHFFHKKGR